MSVDADECRTASHFAWLSEFNLPSYPKAAILCEIAPKSRESWSLAAGAMNIAYYHAAIGDVVLALDHLTEAEALLPSLPSFLKRGFQLVLGNLESYIQTGDSGDEAPEDPEILAAIWTLKALTLQAYDNIVQGDLLGASVKCMVKALEQMPGNVLFMYIRAMFEFFVDDRDFNARPCSEELVKLLFEVEDRLPSNPEVLDEQVVRALTAMVIRNTISNFRRVHSWKPEVSKWSVGQLWRVIENDVGGLPVWFATTVAYLGLYCRTGRHSAMSSFLARYARLYPQNSKLLFTYGRFLLDVEGDIEGGSKVMTRAAEVRDRHAIKAIVYLARSHLKAGRKEAVEKVQKMFDDFEANVPESTIDVVTLIHRGAFHRLIVKDFRNAVTDWTKAMDIDLDNRLHTAYTQDWSNTGRMHTVSPAEIMREQLPAYIAKSTGADQVLYKDALEKVEDFFRRKKSSVMENECKPVTGNATDLAKLENLFLTRMTKVSNSAYRPIGRLRR